MQLNQLMQNTRKKKRKTLKKLDFCLQHKGILIPTSPPHVIQGQTIVLHHRLLGTSYFMIVLILRHLFSLTYTDIHIYLSYPLSWFWTG